MEYKFSIILDLAQRAFNLDRTKQIKPIKWTVSPEDLHRFMVCVLQDHKVIKKENLAIKQAIKQTDEMFNFLKPKKKKKTKVKRKK